MAELRRDPALPELAASERWSACLPLNDASVYAGMSSSELRQRRRAILDAIARQALALT